MNADIDLVICGLSGQGVILASRILAAALAEAGHTVKLTEVPGIKHRYTLTQSFIRVGSGKHASRIAAGEVDLLLGFEPFESLRVGLHYCRPGASVVYNTKIIETRHITSRTLRQQRLRMPAPEDMRRYFAKIDVDDIRPVDATGLALGELRNAKTQNIILVGAAFATGKLPLEGTTLEAVIRRFAPKGTTEVNLAAFRCGMQAAGAHFPPDPSG
jgi:indolepyruvate ferredoxin oxidoreductase beta subunit